PEVVLEHALDGRPPTQDVLAEPVALPALRVVRDVDVRLAHGATRARGARWHRGQWNVLRPPMTVRRIEAPHRSHGPPSRPYTTNSCCMPPCLPLLSRYVRSVEPCSRMALRSTHRIASCRRATSSGLSEPAVRRGWMRARQRASEA